MQSNTLFTIPGPWRVPIEFDASLLILLGFVIVFLDGPFQAYGLVFAVVVIASVLLHELGHAWACLVQGVPVARIVLHGGGGFCQHAASRDTKKDEFIIICGPLVNLAIWAIASLLEHSLGAPSPTIAMVNGTPVLMGESNTNLRVVLNLVATLNIFLFAFNLLPILPLDGGAYLNAFLHRYMRGVRANRISGLIGVIAALVWLAMAAVALGYFGFVLLFIPDIILHWRMMRTGMR